MSDETGMGESEARREMVERTRAEVQRHLGDTNGSTLPHRERAPGDAHLPRATEGRALERHGLQLGMGSAEQEYENLPASIKMVCTLKEYRWLGAEGRARLMQDITEPDVEEP